ncbi:CMT1A duplicated region transcript 4 protein [Octodon degus]|uniref:CMT1A duplicated region transcript 4 protein n=1 Tax=Octodon degus TaxID=10160 RepID=A0A6P6ERY1_OCTDE|nr:CMT1A duplicated region transcript 4 protein [Octodon degus]
MQQSKLDSQRRVRSHRNLTGITENIGLPLNLLEKHNPWPAYVTYTSPVVQRLIEKSKMKELQSTRAFEQIQQALRLNKSSSTTQLQWRMSSKSSGEELKDVLSDTMLSVWGPNSVSVLSPMIAPEPMHIQTASRESPTENYNKIVFSRKPMMRVLPTAQLTTAQQGEEACKCQTMNPCNQP